jgi:hypothetical protein
VHECVCEHVCVLGTIAAVYADGLIQWSRGINDTRDRRVMVSPSEEGLGAAQRALGSSLAAHPSYGGKVSARSTEAGGQWMQRCRVWNVPSAPQ